MFLAFQCCLETLTLQLNQSCITGYVPQLFKVILIKMLLKKKKNKPPLDPGVLANYDQYPTFLFISKILEKNQLLISCVRIFKHDYCEDYWSSFRKYRSRETALVKIPNNLLAHLTSYKLRLTL